MKRPLCFLAIFALSWGCTGGGGGINVAPTAVVPSSIEAEVGRVVYLDASSSYDPEGDPLKFYWNLESIPPDSVDVVLADRYAPVAVLIPDVPGIYSVSLTVSDGFSTGLPAGVTVNVSPGVLKPTPVIEKSGDPLVGERVELRADLSVNPLQEEMNFRWELVDAPEGSSAYLSVITGPYTSFVADVPHGRYRARLTLRNRKGGPASNTATLLVKNSPPRVELMAVRVPERLKSLPVASQEQVEFDVSTADPDGDSVETFVFTYTYRSYAGEPTGAGFHCPGYSGYHNTCITTTPEEVLFFTGENSLFEGSFVVSLTGMDEFGGTAVDSVVLERASVAPPSVKTEDSSTGHLFLRGEYTAETRVKAYFTNSNTDSQRLDYSVQLQARPRSDCHVSITPPSGALDMGAGDAAALDIAIHASGSHRRCVGTYRFVVEGCFGDKCMERSFALHVLNKAPAGAGLFGLPATVEVECETDADGKEYSLDSVNFQLIVSGRDTDGDPVILTFSADRPEENANGIVFSPGVLRCASGEACPVLATLKGSQVCVSRELSWCLFVPCWICVKKEIHAVRPGKTFFSVQVSDGMAAGPSTGSFVEVKCR